MNLKEKMTALADAVRAKADLTDTLTIDEMTDAVNGLAAGNLTTETLTVTPSKSVQSFSSSDLGENTCYSTVTVNAIPAEYITTTDATASTYDILEGETAYVNGEKVTGRIKNYGDVTETFSNASSFLSIKANGYFHTITVNLTPKTLEVTPTKSAQTFRASSEGSDVFYTKVNVSPIPDEYIATADATATAGDILEGETAYVNGEKVTGVYIPVEEQDVRWGATFGYGGSLGFKVGTFSGDATATAEDIAPGKTAYAYGSKLTGAMPSKQAETYTPGTADITIKSGGYLSGDQVIKGDSALTAENIKAGISIFNVSGTFTSDATATASDIAKDKTAYVNGEKITGMASLASGYNVWGFLNYRLVQEMPTSDHIAVPSQRRGSFNCINGKILWIQGSTIATESEPLADVEYLYSPPSDSPTAYGIADGRLYYFWENGYGVIQRRPLAQDLTNVSELCVVNGDRCLCKDGSVIYAVHSDGSSYQAVSGLSASKMLNYYSYSKAAVITTSGDIAQVYWYDNDPSYNISDADKGNGNPFTNVNYVGSEDIYLDYGGAAYMLAFRETGFWYKDAFNTDASWNVKTPVPDLIRTNLLGYCVTSREEYYNYDPDTGEEDWGYVNKEKEVALHIDTSGRLWKIAAACDDNGNGTGLNITQVGSDSDWQYAPPSIKPGQSINNRRFAQKGGKLIMLKTDNEGSMGITWEEYPFSPNGRMIAYSEDGPTVIFSVSGNLPDLTRAGGMI